MIISKFCYKQEYDAHMKNFGTEKVKNGILRLLSWLEWRSLYVGLSDKNYRNKKIRFV